MRKDKDVQLTFEQYERPSARSKQGDSSNRSTKARTLTVSELTEIVKRAIGMYVPTPVLVVGELSNVVRAGSGHLYFTLKDDASQVAAVMWKSRAERLKFDLADGLAVLAEGRVDVYGPRGQYQLYAEKLQPYGLGELELAFRQLREKLENEGLFDPLHKKPLPPYPLSIAVVTSATGAAIRDILRTIELRWPVGMVRVYPVQVQGDSAAGEIAEAIDTLNAQADRVGGIDVMIVGRGGGSLEDLWAFNEEIVARAIYRSKIPIVAGVGHESDVTIADLVADVRAATPTAAAQAVTPILAEVDEELAWLLQRLKRRVVDVAATARAALETLAGKGMFVHPIVLLGRFGQELDDLTATLRRSMVDKRHDAHTIIAKLSSALERINPHAVLDRTRSHLSQTDQQLRHAMGRYLDRRRWQLDREATRLRANHPARALPQRYETVQTLGGQLAASQKRTLQRRREQLDHFQARLDGCNFRRVLERGFSIVRNADTQEIIESVRTVNPGEAIITELADGRLRGTVDDVQLSPSDQHTNRRDDGQR